MKLGVKHCIKASATLIKEDSSRLERVRRPITLMGEYKRGSACEGMLHLLDHFYSENGLMPGDLIEQLKILNAIKCIGAGDSFEQTNDDRSARSSVKFWRG